MPSLQAFEKQQYLNIETFRKNGQGVKTPVWFVQEGEALHIWTEMTSGKAKRIRHNPQVNVVPCKSAGEPLGEWMPATAQVDGSPAALKHLVRLMRKKYGLLFLALRALNQMRGGKYTALSVRLS